MTHKHIKSQRITDKPVLTKPQEWYPYISNTQKLGQIFKEMIIAYISSTK